VSIRNIDVPDTRGRSSVDGIAVDVVAPDPRAYGVVSSDSTGLPVHGGGLVFDTSPSTRWTGTPNASTSTLSQDGTVVAKNLFPTPRPASADMGNTSITQTDDGFTIKTNKTYTGGGDDHFLYPDTVAGETYHLHAETDDVLTTTLPDLSIWINDVSVPGGLGAPNTYLSSTSVIDMDIPATGGTSGVSFKCGMTAGDHVTWRQLGLYTAADWAAMQALGVDWFDGDSYPGHLLFPVGFGSPGSDGRARFANTGTAPASVTMTVVGGGSEGITLKRVENSAVLTLSRPCNPDDRIIFDSSDGSVLLNGQAELSGWMTTDDYDRFDVEAGDTCTVQLSVMGEIVGVPRLTVSAAPAYW
jgi:hypothetical protein